MNLLYIRRQDYTVLSMAHEDHRHFRADLYFNYLIKRAYWPTQVKDIYAWC